MKIITAAEILLITVGFVLIQLINFQQVMHKQPMIKSLKQCKLLSKL